MTEQSAATRRAQRLQGLRKKMGITRAEFSELTGMSANTLKALELGSREITPQKARLYSNIFSNLGVSFGEDAYEASFEYLYYGQRPESPMQTEQLTESSDEKRMQDEISALTANPFYIFLEVIDETMSPFYNEGDVVVGKKIVNKRQFQLYQGRVCIIETVTGDKILRRIIKSDNRKLMVCTLNHKHSSIGVVEEVEAQYIAHAVRHWRLSEIPAQVYLDSDD